MVVVFTLCVILLAGNGQPGSYTMDYKTEDACQTAAAAAHEAAERALGVLDIGTICVRSELNANRKPRA